MPGLLTCSWFPVFSRSGDSSMTNPSLPPPESTLPSFKTVRENIALS